MNFSYRHLLPEDFSPLSRVWIYQASRLLTPGEALEAESHLEEFSVNWTSHDEKVKGYAQLIFGQFVVVMADETSVSVGGCSTDSSVRMIKELEKNLGINMFDRYALAFIVNNKVELLPMSQLPYAMENQFINEDTLYFNNLVQTKEELENNWIIPVKESWLAKKISMNKSVS